MTACLSRNTKILIRNLSEHMVNFSFKDHPFLRKIHNSIKANKITKHIFIKNIKIIQQNNQDIIAYCKDNPFIANNIIDQLSKCKMYHITIIYKNNYINLFVPINKTIIFPKINRIFHIIDFMRSFSDSKNHLTLNIFYTDHIKKLNGETELSSLHINSGSCYRGKMITIWRKEEFEKVLIHELIHFLELDFTELIGKEYFFGKFGIKPVKVYESFTDSLAIIIHTVFVSVYTNKCYLELLNTELNFVLFQAAKITNHYGANCINDLKGKIKQSTDVISYYIIKASILFNLHTLLSFFEKNIYFNNRNKEFMAIINMGLNHIMFNRSLNYYKIINKKIHNEYIKNSLRMTILELV